MNRSLLLILPLALLAACSNPPAPPAATPAAVPATAIDSAVLTANHWQLSEARDAGGQRLDALFARADHPLTLDFKQGRLSASNTCNRMSGSYTVDGATLTVGAMASTMMACNDPTLMTLDQAVGEHLQGALKVEALDAATLKLVNAKGDVLTFRGAPTAETRYGGQGETVFLEVGAQTRPCAHGGVDAQCLQTREIHYAENGVKQGAPGAFENFYGNIEGYTHQAGVRNVLRLKRYTLAYPPADGSSQAYVLDMVVESETARP
ncbi:MAG: META domain-containing protein [Stenotrophomonas sp.]